MLTVAPATSAPRPTSTGTDSPVSIDWSTADSPSTTTPSVAIFSPGRTTKQVADLRARRPGRAPPAPSRSTRASFAPSSSSLRIASRRAALRARLEVAAEQDQRRDDGGDLEVRVRVERRRRGRPSTRARPRACRSRSACPSSPRRGARSAAPRGGSRRPQQKTTGVASASATHSQPANWSGGTIASSATGTRERRPRRRAAASARASGSSW